MSLSKKIFKLIVRLSGGYLISDEISSEDKKYIDNAYRFNLKDGRTYTPSIKKCIEDFEYKLKDYLDDKKISDNLTYYPIVTRVGLNTFTLNVPSPYQSHKYIDDFIDRDLNILKFFKSLGMIPVNGDKTKLVENHKFIYIEYNKVLYGVTIKFINNELQFILNFLTGYPSMEITNEFITSFIMLYANISLTLFTTNNSLIAKHFFDESDNSMSISRSLKFISKILIDPKKYKIYIYEDDLIIVKIKK